MTNRPTTRVPRTAPAAAWISTPARHACLGFGLVPVAGASATDPVALTDIERAAVGTPGVVLVTGPSGSGKSCLLETITRDAAQHGRRVVRCATPGDAGLCVLDAVGACPAVATDALGASGLGEPALWVRDVGLLSVGERARLSLAGAMARARRGDLVACDEFATPLDRAGAQALCRTAARWAGRCGVTLLVAGAHEDLARFLTTDAVIRTVSPGVRRVEPGRDAGAIDVRFEPGTRADLDALASLHYRAGRPATMMRVLRAVRTMPDGTESTAGVLAVSMPVLNGVWRSQAWPGRYAGADRRRTARRLNGEVRCISRVIVEPRSRGLGIASALVRAYLRDPLTPATEAAAAMGAVTPFFRTAGMTEYELPRPAHDARLADAIDHAGLSPGDLVRPGFAPGAFVRCELERWARHAKVRPAAVADALTTIAAHAACRLAARPRAYAHTDAGEDR